MGALTSLTRLVRGTPAGAGREADDVRKRMHVYLLGHVQGVGFRWYVMQTVRQRFPGLDGWVKNCPDGRVEVLAEGSAKDLTGLHTSLAKGPPGADVLDMETEWLEPRGGLHGFDVTF